MSNRDELERVRRLRERQLGARDPYKKQRQVDQKVGQKFKKKNENWQDILRAIPNPWWGMIIGGVAGFILALLLDRVLKVRLLKLEAFWVEYLWYTLVLIGAVIGRLLGAVLDWQGEDHEKMVVRGRK